MLVPNLLLCVLVPSRLSSNNFLFHYVLFLSKTASVFAIVVVQIIESGFP